MEVIIDVREPGLWVTLVSYQQSIKHWDAEKNPIYKRAADKERQRYRYLKDSIVRV